MMPLRLIGAHWRRNFIRTLLTMLSVTLAIFLFAFMRTFLTSLEQVVTSSSSSRYIVSSAVSLFVQLPVNVVPKVTAMPGVRRVSHWTWFGGVYKENKVFFGRFGCDVASFRTMYGDKAAKGELAMPTPQWDAFENEKSACIIGKDLLDNKELGFELGKQVTIQGDIFPTDLTFTIRGVYTSNNPAYDQATLFFHWSYMDDANDRRGDISTVQFECDNDGAAADVAKRIDDTFRSSATPTLSQPEQAFQAQFLTMWGPLPLVLNSIGTVILIACFLVTLNTMLMSARERVREVGVLKTLGFSDGTVAGVYLLEAVLAAALGGGIALALMGWVARGESLILGPLIFPSFLLEMRTILMAAVLTLVVGLAAGIGPAMMALRLPIVRALRRV